MGNRIRIGYIVPRFPGQTHAFFWREVIALRKMGVEVRLFSTRPPHRSIQPHSWARDAKQSTVYLFPLSYKELALAVGFLWASGRPAWRKIRLGVLGGGFRRVPRNLALLLIATKLARIVLSEELTHLHIHSCADSALVAAFASHLGAISYSLTLHGALTDYGPMQEFKWSGASFGITVTHRLRDELIAAIGTVVAPRVAVAPMGVDLDAFTRRQPYSPWSGEGLVRVVSCGRLHPGKGHEDLIRAVGMLAGSGLAVSLRICGQDESGGDGYALRLNELIHQMNLHSVVELLGAVSEEQVIAELEDAHIFALASHQEAIGVAYMEAMAMGVPTIGTRVGGVSELICDGVNGLLVDAKKPLTLAETITRIAFDPDLALRLSNSARTEISKHFHSRRSATTLCENIKLNYEHLAGD